MTQTAGEDISQNNLINTMLDSEESWDEVTRAMREIIQTKEKKEKKFCTRGNNEGLL